MESNVTREAWLKVGMACPNTRLFRNNTGKAYQGEVAHRDGKSLTLVNVRYITMGLVVGGSDSIGWTSVEVTPDMVGKKVAIFTAIEFKDGKKGNPSDDQLNFIDNVQQAGGISGLVRFGEEAVALIQNFNK